MAKSFSGKIDLDVRDSVPDWDAFTEHRAPEGAPNVLVVLYDDTGQRGVVALRRADRDADPGPPRGQRADLQPVAHDRAVLADALRRSSPAATTTERLRVDLRVRRAGFPGYSSHIPRENGDAGRACCATPATARSGSARTTTSPVDAWTQGSSKKELAARPRLRPLLRLHRRRDQPVVSGPGRGQPLRRAALPARGRLPPLQGPRRQGAARSSATPSSPSPTSPGTCGSAPGPTTRRTTPRRSSSTSTRASSTTATRPTASGCCRA